MSSDLTTAKLLILISSLITKYVMSAIHNTFVASSFSGHPQVVTVLCSIRCGFFGTAAGGAGICKRKKNSPLSGSHSENVSVKFTYLSTQSLHCVCKTTEVRKKYSFIILLFSVGQPYYHKALSSMLFKTWP